MEPGTADVPCPVVGVGTGDAGDRCDGSADAIYGKTVGQARDCPPGREPDCYARLFLSVHCNARGDGSGAVEFATHLADFEPADTGLGDLVLADLLGDRGRLASLPLL